MGKTRHYLNLSETSRRFGISCKALRLYEAKGLIKPQRSRADWRVYGPEDFVRLQQIMALKSFGLPLGRIAELLSGRNLDLSAFLALHEAMLQRQKQDIEQAISLISAARSRLATEGKLSPDDLIDLTRRAIMTNSPERQTDYETIAAKHLTQEDRDILKSNGYEGMDKPNPDWDALISEATQLMATSEPESPEAMDLARRWMAQVALATGGKRELNEKVRAVAREMHEQPAYQQQSKSSIAMMDYVGKAYGAAIAAGIMPKP